MEFHFRMFKSDLSTSGSFSRSFHDFFTAFSRVFHGLLTNFSRPFHYFRFCIGFVFFRVNFRRNNEDMIFRPPTTILYQANIGQVHLQRLSFKPVAPWQIAGKIFFYSYLIEGNIEGGSKYQIHCISFYYTIMMNHDLDGRSWLFLDNSSQNLMMCLLFCILISFWLSDRSAVSKVLHLILFLKYFWNYFRISLYF